jgi:two-component system, NarL family, sensor kinase
MDTTATLLREPETLEPRQGAPGTGVVEPETPDEHLTRLTRTHERQRITREVHEELARDLDIIRLEIERALAQLNDRPALARQRVVRAIAATSDSLSSTRRSVLDLRSGLPSGRSLGDAIGELGRALSTETGAEVRVEVAGAFGLSFRVEVGLYRVIQAWLGAVRERSRATRVRIELLATPTDVRLSAWDDDVHHSSSAATGQETIELCNDVQALGGSMRVRSEPAIGTHLLVRVPHQAPRPCRPDRDGLALDPAGVGPA